MRLTRDFYRPSASVNAVMQELPEVPGSEVYRYENNGHPVAMAFGGKRSKPDFHFRFPNEERREEKISEWASGQVSRADSMKASRKERNKPHDFKPGQLFYCSWGYDQTNIDYYKLVELKGKTMGYIVPIGAKTISSKPPQEMVAPDPDYIREWDVLLRVDRDSAEKGKWKRLGPDGFSPSRHYHASPCEPETARYETSSGWGH